MEASALSTVAGVYGLRAPSVRCVPTARPGRSGSKASAGPPSVPRSRRTSSSSIWRSAGRSVTTPSVPRSRRTSSSGRTSGPRRRVRTAGIPVRGSNSRTRGRTRSGPTPGPPTKTGTGAGTGMGARVGDRERAPSSGPSARRAGRRTGRVSGGAVPYRLRRGRLPGRRDHSTRPYPHRVSTPSIAPRTRWATSSVNERFGIDAANPRTATRSARRHRRHRTGARTPTLPR